MFPYLSQKRTMILKGCNLRVWNKILNIKPCMGHISGTWELLLCEYWKKSMIIGEKNTDLKRLTGQLKLHLLTEIGRLHWNQGEEVAHFAWFGEPCFRYFIYTVKKTFQCLNGAAVFNKICALRLVLTVKHWNISGSLETVTLDAWITWSYNLVSSYFKIKWLVPLIIYLHNMSQS
jgi:hypothetical protein